MQLTEHFSLSELTNSSTAQRKGIDNSAPQAIVENLKLLAGGLEKVRSLLGSPLHIDSGYRCPALNSAVGGAGHSAHMDGYAADFTCAPFGTPLEIVKAVISSDIDYDKIIEEGTWVHISFAPSLCKLTMTAHFGPNGTTYSKGVS